MMTNIYIKTFGCTVNQSDSEVMAGLLSKAEFDIVDDVDSADIVIVNTCVVKGPSETNALKYIDKINNLGKKLIIAGCITKTKPKQLLKYSLISPKNVCHIVSVVEEMLNDHTVHLIADDKNPRLNLPKSRKNEVVEIIPICAGCLGACAYCIVKKARGHLFSYQPDSIIEQAICAIKSGVKEIWITAQDTGAYGYDIDYPLPKLLWRLVELNGDFKIRLGMINPNHVLKHLDELIGVFQSDKMFKFLHIPVQSGNNVILSKMNRKYTVEDFKYVIEKFKKKIPMITIATDIICGFPGETESQFNNTIELIRWLNPDIINISKYWQRSGTKAARMKKKVSGDEIKKRSRYLFDLFKNIGLMVNEKWYNWVGDIIIDDIGKDGTFIGRNYAYRPVVVLGNFQIGDKIRVRIKNVTCFHLKGEEIRKITI